MSGFPTYPIVAVYAVDWALVADQVATDTPWQPICGWIVGWCIEDTPDYLVLAPQYFPVEDQVRYTIVIPRVCIQQEYAITQEGAQAGASTPVSAPSCTPLASALYSPPANKSTRLGQGGEVMDTWGHEWEPLPESLEYDYITQAMREGGLSDGVRLCRRVPAAQGVPVEVREAIDIVIGRAGKVGTHEEMKYAILDACELVAGWLDAQPHPGQEGE